MNNINFYKNLDSFDKFSDMTKDEIFTSLPNTWSVAITDIVNSTQAIENGLYKSVNFCSALGIIGILNIDRKIELPYVFGGDGAVVLIPNELKNKVENTLFETAKIAQNSYNLDLRIAIISVDDIRKNHSDILISKYKVSNNYFQVIIKGNGLEIAEKLLKEQYQKYKIKKIQNNNFKADFTGLECRWENIKTTKDVTVSFIIKATNDINSQEIYENILHKFKDIAGSKTQRNPIKIKRNLFLSFNPKLLKIEAKLNSKTFLERFLIISKMMLENLIGLILIKSGYKKWKFYKRRIIKTTDTEKFDDTLRMVISLSNENFSKIKDYLKEEHSKKNIVYGYQESDSALMTCLIFERHGKHVHFVDSSNGGYALASKMMKNQLKQL